MRVAPPLLVALSLAAATSACKSKSPSGPTNEIPGFDAASDDGGVGGTVDPIRLAEPREVNGEFFATAQVCAQCHQNSASAEAMRDEQGQEIGQFDLWRSTMMANAARDPLWRAAVSAEVAATPSRKELIEETCMSCHAPMAGRELTMTGADGSEPLSLLYGDSDVAQLGLDGVSCTACHQAQPEGLGTSATFDGKFLVGEERQIFGPHSQPFAMPMEMHTGFRPTPADHMTDSALCASCHTLHTDALRPDGSLVGVKLPEQTPFLEWQHSLFSRPESRIDCQGCHVPTESEAGVPISTRIARNPGGMDFPPVGERSPYGRHLFVGGNTLVPAILRDFSEELRPNAPAAAFDATIAAAREQLQSRTAVIGLENARLEGGEGRVDLRIRVATGHKFPTAHPARRAWVHLKVVDRQGAILFESGAVNADAKLVNSEGQVLDSDTLSGGFQPHHQEISSSDQVQVYESVMGDEKGAPTYRLLRGAQYLKDNRLLPAGFDVPSASADIAPIGTASDDDFQGGEDVVSYRFPVPRGSGRLSIEAELLYQPLSGRYAVELFAYDTPEVVNFKRYYEASDKTPVVVSTDSESL